MSKTAITSLPTSFLFEHYEVYHKHLITVRSEQIGKKEGYNFVILTPDEASPITPMGHGHFEKPEDAIEVGKKWLDYWIRCCELMA